MGKNGKRGAGVNALTTKVIGSEAENLACVYLQRQGLYLVERNYLCRGGEIDLIMQHTSCLIFVEVRYRQASCFGSTAATVNREKQRRLIKAAHHYLLKHPSANEVPCRFDVLTITSYPHKPMDIIWIKDAFEASF
jgi:putative endonuclease